MPSRAKNVVGKRAWACRSNRDRVKLAAFSTHDENELIKNKITSIVQPDKEIAETAFAILTKAIAGEEYLSNSDIVLPARII